jgi:hypothetical protein
MKMGKILCVLFLMFGSFFSGGKIQAAAPSQCLTGQDGGPQTGCSHDADASILSGQCLLTYGPSTCSSMSSYLAEMQADCNQVKPAGIDCSLITSGGFYGREASRFASYLEGAGASTGGSTNNIPPSGGSVAPGQLDFPDEFNLPDNPRGLRGVVATFLNWLLAVVGILAMIAFAVSGLQYFLAAGDENQMASAKRNLTYSILGVIAALSGFIVVRAVDAALNATTSLF